MRIGIVNDLPMAVEALRRAVALDPAHQIAWIAMDGVEAVAACARDTPDLVLMDLVMPRMNGVEATRRIMAESPCAIVVVTVNVGANASRVYEAMGHGALDAVDTPELGSGDERRAAAPLLAKIETIGKLLGDRRSDAPARSSARPSAATSGRWLVAIGASAGGPAALSTLLGGLPPTFPSAIVIVQHVDEHFAAGMADWLNGQSRIPVRLAVNGASPIPGTALLAATGDHLALVGPERLGYTPEPREYVYRPSVDVFFDSVVRHWRGDTVGVLLTGMGRDGATGLKALRDKGVHTIAQDRETCAVYGMPKAAAALDAAVEILPLQRIAPRLLQLVGAAR